MLPRSKAVPASVNLGVLLLQSGTRDTMTKQLRRLVGRFVIIFRFGPGPGQAAGAPIGARSRGRFRDVPPPDGSGVPRSYRHDAV